MRDQLRFTTTGTMAVGGGGEYRQLPARARARNEARLISRWTLKLSTHGETSTFIENQLHPFQPFDTLLFLCTLNK